MSRQFLEHLQQELHEIESSGLLKKEYTIDSPQDAKIQSSGKSLINLCSNNYLGLANHPEIIEAGRSAFEQYGFGMASVRFICGTSTLHKNLETELSHFLGTEDSILYSSCFDANAGLFETILGPEDAIISDELNHASIIDGIRLTKSKRLRYKNSDMKDLEEKLLEARSARFRVICTDGIFSMDGIIANLAPIVELAEKYDALLMVDDSHGVGFMGKEGRGTHEACDVLGKIDILTGTFGKALGGAAGGYTSGKKELISILRQRSRPYLFSNSLAPMIASASLKALDLVKSDPEARGRLWDNTNYFRNALTDLGFQIASNCLHPIVPVLTGDAKLAGELSSRLSRHGIYAIGFSYPVVPKGRARVRTQMSAAHSRGDLERAVEAFKQVGKELKII